MPTLTKKPPTKRTRAFRGRMAVLRIRIPESAMADINEHVRALGGSLIEPSKESESVPWREAFPKVPAGSEGGISLAARRDRLGITQKALEKATGIRQAHISAMENGKRPIGKDSAKKFAKVLKTDYRMFL